MKKAILFIFSLSLLSGCLISNVLAQRLGQERVLVVPIKNNSYSLPKPLPTREQIQTIIFGGAPGVLSLKGYLEEASYGKFTITGDVLDWDDPNPPPYFNYNKIIKITWAKELWDNALGNLITLNLDGGYFLDVPYIAHEYGHTLGLGHAPSIFCPGGKSIWYE